MAAIKAMARDYGGGLKNDAIVLLYVENCEKPYKVQRLPLTRASKWFESALSEQVHQRSKLELQFPDTQTETLELFLKWLFEGELAQEASNSTNRSIDDIREEHLMWVNLWMFADKHLITKLQNESMQRLYQLTESSEVSLSTNTIRFAYETTASGSLMRQFMIDHVGLGLSTGPGDMDSYIGYASEDIGGLGDVPGFTEDLARAYMWEVSSRDMDDPFTLEVSSYLVDVD